MKRNLQLELWSQWIQSIIDTPDHRAYLVTFEFAPMNGSFASIISRMEKDIDTFYVRLLTRTIRTPKTLFQSAARPMIVGAFDQPVAKRDKHAISAWLPNDGLHVHAVVSVPKESRYKARLKAHLKRHEDAYLSNMPYLRTVHAVRITETPDRVGPYILKSISRGRFEPERLIVLPKSRSEL